MKKEISPSEQLAKIHIPKQDLSRLEFCESNKAVAVKNWIDSLLATQVLHTSTQLYKATSQVSRLKTDFKNRLEMLEALRPSVNYCVLGLKKNFLNQPIILPKESQKAAIVAQSMQKNMIDGYLAVIMQIKDQSRANSQTMDMLAKALHRAISGIGLLFFRNYQMYTKTPPSLWAVLHSLYIVANYYELRNKVFQDSTLTKVSSLSITNAYVRVLMLATSKTNQLNQYLVETAFDHFELWCQLVKVKPNLSEGGDNIYAVDLLGNKPPVYKLNIDHDERGRYLELDFEPLMKQLDNSSDDLPALSDSGLRMPNDVPTLLLDHLSHTWKYIAKRKQLRQRINSSAEICAGLTNCHFFLCNGQEFNYFVRNSGQTNNYGSNSYGFDEETQPRKGRHVYRVSLKNQSPGGYCLLWKGDKAPKMEAGELLGIKETGQRTWSVGVVRWVRQLKQASQLGVQILSKQPKPYGVTLCLESADESDYSRALYFPPSELGNDAVSILTTKVPFKEFDKVQVIDGDREWAAKFDKSIFSTTSTQQFLFHPLDNKRQNVGTLGNSGNFDQRSYNSNEAGANSVKPESTNHRRNDQSSKNQANNANSGSQSDENFDSSWS